MDPIQFRMSPWNQSPIPWNHPSHAQPTVYNKAASSSSTDRNGSVPREDQFISHHSAIHLKGFSPSPFLSLSLPELPPDRDRVEDTPEHLLEGAVLRPHGGDPRRQGHGARPHRRHLRGQPQAHPLPLPRPQDAPDPAREGHRRRVHQERGLQVCSCTRCLLLASHRNRYGCLSIFGASVQ